MSIDMAMFLRQEKIRRFPNSKVAKLDRFMKCPINRKLVYGLQRHRHWSEFAQNLLGLIEIFSSKRIYTKMLADSKSGNLKYSELKEQLSKDITEYFSVFRSKKEKIKEKEVLKVLEQGKKNAQKVASNTISEVRKKIGIR